MRIPIPSPKQRVTLSLVVILSLLFSGCDQLEQEFLTEIEDYAAARSVFWGQLYSGQGNTLYCNADYNSYERQDINIEHVFPMSWVTNALECGTRKQCRARSSTFNRIEADLHNLYPARTSVNSARASFKFGEVRGERRQYGRECDFEVDHRSRVAEPRLAVRGEVARAMFYMAYRYRKQGLILFERSGRILQQWHNEDPPTPQERARNDQIERLQGNRNQFIDEPELLNQLIANGTFY